MTKLCPRGKSAAKRKFKVYPSAYANAYASKICAGKIKDPSGTKRKDFKGPKPTGAKKGALMIMIAVGKKKKVQKKMGGGMTAGSRSALGRLQKAAMMSKGGGFDAGTPGKVRDILNKQVRVGNRIAGRRPTKSDMDKLKKIGRPKLEKILRSKKFNKGGESKDKMKTKPYGIEDRKVKIEKIMTRKEKAAKDKKYGIGLYMSKGGGADFINTVKPRKRGNPAVVTNSDERAKKKGIIRKANKYSQGGDAKIKKVIKGLRKASKTHAGQAKTLSTIKLRGGGAAIRGTNFKGVF